MTSYLFTNTDLSLDLGYIALVKEDWVSIVGYAWCKREGRAKPIWTNIISYFGELIEISLKTYRHVTFFL
jgi:hypothetical protein